MKFPGEVTFGSIIETLTSGIYDGNSNSMREYIQNAIDSGSKKIEISYQNNDAEIVIRDYGMGMDKNELTNALSLGASKKPPSEIGWRGIGIYSGIPNFKRIIITTKKSEEKKLTVEILSEEIRSRYLSVPRPSAREILESGTTEITEIDDPDFEPGTQITLLGTEQNQKTFFTPDRLKNKLIRVLPLPLREDSIFKEKIIQVLKKNGIEEPDFEIFFNGKKLYRPPTDESIFDPDSFVSGLYKADDETALFVFWAITSQENAEIENRKKNEYDRLNRGLIFKLKGMTIGDERSPEITVSRLYSGKYNFWNYGEIHVLDSNIRENAGRNNFETLTGHAGELFGKVAKLIEELQKNNRQKSSTDKRKKLADIEDKIKNKTISKQEAKKELKRIKKAIEGSQTGSEEETLRSYSEVLRKRKEDELKKIEGLLKEVEVQADVEESSPADILQKILPKEILNPISQKIKNPEKRLERNLFSQLEEKLSSLAGIKKEEFNKLVSEVFAIQPPGDLKSIKQKAKVFIIDPLKIYNDSPNDTNNQKYTYLINANFGQAILALYQIFVNGEKHHSDTFKKEWYDKMSKEDRDLFFIELGCTIDLFSRIIERSKPRDSFGPLP